MKLTRNDVTLTFYTYEECLNAGYSSREEVVELGLIEIGPDIYFNPNMMGEIYKFLIPYTFDTAVPQNWVDSTGNNPYDYVWVYKPKSIFGEPFFVGNWKDQLYEVVCEK